MGKASVKTNLFIAEKYCFRFLLSPETDEPKCMNVKLNK